MKNDVIAKGHYPKLVSKLTKMRPQNYVIYFSFILKHKTLIKLGEWVSLAIRYCLKY